MVLITQRYINSRDIVNNTLDHEPTYIIRDISKSALYQQALCTVHDQLKGILKRNSNYINKLIINTGEILPISLEFNYY